MISRIPLYNFYFNRFCGLVVCALLPLLSLQAQDRCGTVEYNKTIYKGISPQNKQDQFEDWLSNKVQQKKRLKIGRDARTDASIVTIPVVVHVIHNNEPIGSGVNITDEQILSQIDVLNEDFRRQNADRVNTPANFIGVAADTEVEFVMAKRDPEGISTSGILRVAGTQSSWSMGDNTVLKSLSYWPAENYLNIWVTAVSGTLLGYAQFPISSELDGLEEGSFNALTDGVVVDYEVFGSISKFPSANLKTNFNRGRTTTHEIGHFLGLRHIWGDATCGTDYCADTPTQRTSTSGCPSHPRSNSCGTSDEMFENFMDYTSDQCMNLFTLDQNDRMRTVLENSPRRLSLTTSPALLDPVVQSNDLGILSVSSPGSNSCNKAIIPEIVVRNYGSNALNSSQISFSVNGNLLETLTVNLGELSQLATVNTTFSEATLVEGNNTLKFEILNVNGVTDQDASNNIIEHVLNIPSIIEPDITEEFQNGIENMTINNIDGLSTWEITDAPDGTTNNKALFINYYSYENEGSEDWLLSPVMDFSSVSFSKFIFDYSHAQYPGRNDQLKVLISQDCGASFQVLFDKSGDELMTTTATSTSSFTPSGVDDWKSESIDLASYVGEPFIQLAFLGKNDFGNNIYLDNINLITSNATSIKLRQIDTPVIVSNGTTQPLSITVKNVGGFTINELDINYTVNDEVPIELTQTNLNLGSGSSTQIVLGDIVADEGIHSISVTIANPNGLDDVDVTDNTLSTTYIVDTSTDGIPLRESFEQVNNWVSATRSDVSWESIAIQGDLSLYVNSAQNNNILGKAWFVSPVLDFSKTTAPYLLFDLSYALAISGRTETLKVLLSEDGGLDNYPHELYNKSGNTLATFSGTQDNWLPEKDNINHWNRDSINLSNYAGAQNIRIAFQLTNGNGNNLYLDNIEFFANANTSPINVTEKEVFHFPNPIFSGSNSELNLTFDLPEQQQATIRIYDLRGSEVFTQVEPYTLNQTFTYDVSDLPSGVLILSIVGETFKYNSRITIIR